MLFSKTSIKAERGGANEWTGRLLVLTLGLTPLATWAQDRFEIVNKSASPWTLALVEGAKPGRGTLTLVDKFTGKTTGSLANVGDGAILPVQGRLLVVFNRDGGYLYRHFILRDPNGFYGEYNATVEFLSAPRISIQLVDQHVGPPMDHADEAAVKQFMSDSIELGSGNIIIHPNTLGNAHPDAPWPGKVPELNQPALPTL